MGQVRARWRPSSLMRLAVLLLTLIDVIRSEEYVVPLGKLFEVTLSGKVVEPEVLPRWLQYDSSSSDSGLLFGVPRDLDDLETVKVVLDNGAAMTITVQEEVGNPCKEEKTQFFEFSYPANDTSPFELRNILRRTAAVLDAEDETKLRLFSTSYLSNYTRETRYMRQGDASEGAPQKGLVVLYQSGCGGALGEEKGEIIANLPDAYLDTLQVFAGRIPHDRKSVTRRPTRILQTRTTPSSSTRTTSSNLAPQLVNRLRPQHCQRGILCVIDVPENTFTDGESLEFSTHTRGNFTNIFTASGHKLEGVPLASGTFDYRLEAQDPLNQSAMATFSLEVNADAEPNHEYDLALYTKYDELKKPEMLVDFVNRLAASLHGAGGPASIRVNSVEKGQDGEAIVRWSLVGAHCHSEKFTRILKAMEYGSNDMNPAFRRKMGPKFNPKKVSLTLMGNCVSSTTPVPPSRRNQTSAVDTTVEAKSTHPLPIAVMVPLVLLVVLFLLLLLIIYCCCAQRKRNQKKKKAGDYLSKGQPVVFPEELPHDLNSEVTASTPMLITHEKPPFDPKMTLHENPLYKPPLALPQSFQPSSSPHHSTTALTSAVGQRKPPPYALP